MHGGSGIFAGARAVRRVRVRWFLAGFGCRGRVRSGCGGEIDDDDERGGFGGERSREQVQVCLEIVRGLCGTG